MKEHIHSWVTTGKHNQLICTDHECQTISTVDTVLNNTAIAAAKAARLEVLITQLRNGDLKKASHDQAYAYVRSQTPPAFMEKQESFLP